jgi:hypothetical protein
VLSLHLTTNVAWDAWRMRAPDALVGDLAAADQLSGGDHG